jgi:hypothetical protein
MQMRRSVLDAIVAVLAIGLGILSFVRGQFWLGVCFTALGVLRLLVKLPQLITPKPPKEIRLDLDGEHGSDEHRPAR